MTSTCTRMKFRSVAAAFVSALSLSAIGQPVAIVHATLIDVTAFGRSEHDIDDAVVLIDGDRIVAVGAASAVRVPENAQVIDARGAFLIPGLIEGFGALRDQGFANAFLYEGITTVYLPISDGSDDRRGKGFLRAKPSPRVFVGGTVTGYSANGESINDNPAPAGSEDGALTQERLTQDPLTRSEIGASVHRMAMTGARGVWIDYDVWPYQVDTVVRSALSLGLATIGELGFTSYAYAIRAGVATFVHNQRYLSSLALPANQIRYGDDPFGKGARPAIREECTIDPSSPAVASLGAQLAASKSTLMPTLAIAVTVEGLSGLPNPWARPSAKLVSPALLHLPVNSATNISPRNETRTAAERKSSEDCVRNMLALDKALHTAGAHFLAGSGTSAFGVMPGGGMHLELEMLTKFVGLTPREAVAAATSNYADTYGWPDVGKIEVGRFADILIINDDPRRSVAALANIRTLLFGGKVLDRDQLLN